MKPLLRFIVSLWTLLVFSAQLKIIQAECHHTCDNDASITVTTNTTTAKVTVGSETNCTNEDSDSRDYLKTNLTPGTVNQIYVKCMNCCKNVTTKPEAVRNLTATDITTSSVSLTWVEPEGKSSFYKVEWTDGKNNGTENTSDTSATIINLTAGVQYTINVTAVAADGQTEGQSTSVTEYTTPGKVVISPPSMNTSTIFLNWSAPSGEVFEYRVEWHNGGAPSTDSTKNTFTVLSDLIPGTAYTVTVFAVAGDNQTGVPDTVTVVTVPASIEYLNITVVTTTTVSLNWTKPQGNVSSYFVNWTTGKQAMNDSTNETSFTIRDLNPGFPYNISVAAVAVNSTNKGEKHFLSTYTRPEKPSNITTTAPGTDYLNISWSLPKGRVDKYVVNISNKEKNYFNSSTTEDIKAEFTDLHPGRIFSVTVTAVAGIFSETSDQFSFATRPTPPGPIIVTQRTNSSLRLNWTTPVLMEGAPDISYSITYQQKGGEVQTADNMVNDLELSGLSSGTSYNITVKTVGPQNLQSTTITHSTFTLPNPVVNLVASPLSTSSVEVKWSYPQGAQQYYTYFVQTNNTVGATVESNSTNIYNLEPGTLYSISVITIAAPEINSTEEQTFTYTMPEAVTNLTAEELDPTTIRLTWQRQSDHKSSYYYNVSALQDAVVVQHGSTTNETFTFSHLIPGSFYTFVVVTVVEGVTSTAKNITRHTKPANASDISVIGSTTNVTVSWTAAAGQVTSYTVLLFKDSLSNSSGVLSNTTLNKLFMNQDPGVLYCAVVVTKSGPLETNSSSICNATFPNPPGTIIVESRTVESINFSWPYPIKMHHDQYNFSVSSFQGSFLIESNWFLLDKLESGSLYNISVVTVGVRGYESTAETAQSYTIPYGVTMLRQAGITTDSVTLVWEQQEKKPYYSYVVKVSNGSSFQTETVSNTTTATIKGLLSGTNYSFTVTTQTADGTKAAPVTVSFFTRPNSVRELKAQTLNTTAVSLVWSKPQEYKDEYNYLVKTLGCDLKNKTVAEEETQIVELPPGTNCTFCVSVTAADGTEGEAQCTSQYTKPETVQPSMSSQGSNSSVLVTWTKPPGHVEFYKVQLNSTSTYLKVQELGADNTSFQFTGLSAGRLYSVMLTTCSGPFNASSGLISNATFPNPPGQIVIEDKTTSSIEIRWTEAPLMTDAAFTYRLTKTSDQKEEEVNTSVTNTEYIFTGLRSGTSYSISVATVGALGFESEKVQSNKVTTRPFSVKNLNANIKEESITVQWDEPNDYKESYRFNVTWQSADGAVSDISKETSYNISNLVPGTLYNISVTTETSDETPSASRWFSNCTDASQVKNITCEGPNTPNAEVILLWTRPNGKHSGFLITVTDDNSKTTNTCCNYTVSNLKHFTDYDLSVTTESCGKPSAPLFHHCTTGITNPPIPENYESLAKVDQLEQNMFSIQIDSKLLNGTNGPITHVGVLVTDNLNLSNNDLKEYLGNTYNQWKQKETSMYLATVKDAILQTRSEEIYHVITVGDKSQWEDYNNGALDTSGKYQYAIVLFTSLQVQPNGLVDVNKSLVSITNIYPIFQLPSKSVDIGMAVGVTLGIFCVFLIILIGFIVYWRRLSNKEPDIQIDAIRAKVSVAVRVEDYEAYYRKQKADSNCGFAEEFEDLKLVGTGQSKTNALILENKPKNRYNNVLPYDSSRVTLSIIHGSPYDDYINANYMPGYNSRKEFIAAQGPLPATVNEFWRMIWEKNVQTVVMLTRCNEQGRVKCEQYWHPGTRHFENLTVTTTSEIPLEDWTIRDFSIKNVKTAETRSARQFHFTAWPDHRVPETTELLISFRHLVREHMDQYSRHSPTVVHCSAGVGRTGTFIAIDRLIFQIERENIVDVYGIVHDLRMHRPLMVQTEDQYVFLNQCAMDIIRARTGTNVDLIYQNTAALSIYENVEPRKGFQKNGYQNA